MAENLIISGNTKKELYESLIPQLKALVEYETDAIANMANICAAIKTTFNFLWVGFYIVKQKQLVLGPFQGPVACTRINFGKGVCGAAWQQKDVIIVDDVDKFPNHITCSSLSKSEIVVPLFNTNMDVIAVLDIDSEVYNCFDEEDKAYLINIIKLISVE